MIKSELNSTKIGVIVLETLDRAYVCSSFTMTLMLNAVPVASVVIGSGRPIKGNTRRENSAEDVLEYIREHELKDATSFLPCTVYEDLDGQRYTAFKGVIVGASLVYKAGVNTMRAVRLELMNEACKLYARPLTDWQDTCGSNITAAVRTGAADALNTGDSRGGPGFEYSGAWDYKAVCNALSTSIEHTDIATRIAKMADAYVTLNSRTQGQQAELDIKRFGNLLGIQDYIVSSYGLNDALVSAMNKTTEQNFNLELCDCLINGIRGGSIMESIISAIASSEFMLALVPRFSDFKLEIKPSKAWDNSNVKQLPLSVLSSMNSSYHPLDHLKDPDVFVVNYSDALDFGGSGQDGAPAGINGAYSSNPTMQAWIQERRDNDNATGITDLLAQLEQDTSHFKWRIYPAPRWLDTAFIQSSNDAYNVRRGHVPDRNYVAGRNLADEIAKAIFTSIYGQASTSVVELLPHMRFGMGSMKYGVILEDMLGEVIDIVPDGWINDPDRLDDSPLSVRGMISSIQFTYTAGQAGSCSYSMTLTRVRPLNRDEQSVECPLYAKL